MGEHHHHEENSGHGHHGHSHHGHSHSGHHHHGHHHPGQGNYDRAFLISVLLNSGFVVIEAVYGVLANSLALIADAGHNFSDVLGLVLVWGASVLAKRRPTPRRTYGMRRSSILAALVNASALLLVCGGIAWEAVQRLRSPDPVMGNTIIMVALIGILINTISALMFVSNQKGDLNIRGAFLHLAADALVSLGVVIAGLAIATTGWLWVDPVVSLIVTVIIVWGTWQLFRDSFNLMLDAVPENVDPLAVRQYLSERSGVNEVHDLHIWAMSTTEIALTVHLVMLEGHPGDSFLAALCQELREKFGIAHSTVQIETGDPQHPCMLAPDHVL
jgi:cobalt-zinc-cadmium efflux system protein